MCSEKSKQMVSGKSFEYALLRQFYEKLKGKTNVHIIENKSFCIAKKCFEILSAEKRSEGLLYASCAINTLIDLEPRLSNSVAQDDILQLELQKDTEGRKGDVRDVLIVRCLQKWEIGISAKINNDAVKHCRLSDVLDFGQEWFGINCSQDYFKEISPIFHNLRELQAKAMTWRSLTKKYQEAYVPVLSAFTNELNRLYAQHKEKIASGLVSYVVGKKDFYKVIKYARKVKIEAFNFRGTLNLPFQNSLENIQAKCLVKRVMLPDELIKIDPIKVKNKNGYTSLLVTLNNNWELSFRIHSAKTYIEPSLKFDVRIKNAPKTLFKISLNVGERA